MTYPSGVQLSTLTFSNPITFLGKSATRTEVTFQSTAGVVWAATGEPIDDFAETVTPDPGMPGSLTAPFVDQPGFTDQSGNAFTMWAYVVTRLTWFGSSVKTVRKNWQPVLGQDTIDFDNLPGGNIGLPVSAPIVPVTSVAGETGVVQADSLADALVPYLPPGASKAATALSTPNTLVLRDSDGLFAVDTPTAGGHPTSKTYVDGALGAKANSADVVPKWKANTAYLAGAQVVEPAGQIVTAKVAFTSGATYSAANWNPSNRLGISPKDYGAVGDTVILNGAIVSGTNDSAAMQAALNAAAKGGLLNLAGGTYYMGTTSLAATLSGPLTITGGGTLVWDSGNGIRLTQNNADHVVTVDGVNLFTVAQGTGVALEVIGTGQIVGATGLQPRTKHRGSIKNVNIRGVRDTGINGWAKGIRLVDVMNFMITQIHIDGYQPNQGNFVSTHGIELVTDSTNAKAVDVVMSQIYVYLVQYALDVQGYEGVLVDQCYFIGVGTGFLFEPVDAGAPLVTFTNGQIAFKTSGLDFRRSHQSIISGNLIYTHSTSGTPDTATGITLTDVTTTRVTGCTFVSNNGMQTGVLIQGSLSKDNVVESSTFYSSITNPVVIGTGPTLNKVRNLTIRSAAQSIINNGGSTNTIELDDTGWLTTGLTVTPGTDWTLTNYRIRKIKNVVWLNVTVAYTGANTTSGADGNLGDLQAATIPTGYRPIYSWPLAVSEFASRMWGGFISTSGVLTLSHGLASQTLSAGKSVTFVGSFMAD